MTALGVREYAEFRCIFSNHSGDESEGGATMPELTMEQAIEAATQLMARIGGQTGDAYQQLETALQVFKDDGYPLESIIPQGEDAKLGFSLKSADARTFFEIYGKLIRKSLCTPHGEFSKLIKKGLDTSVGAVLTAIVTTLGIPLAALGVIIPVAVIITNTGLQAFCEFTAPKK